MPALINSIDAFEFLDLQGNLAPRSEDLEVISYPGIDDVRVRTTGVRGQAVQLRSVNFLASFAAAAAALDDYLTLKDGTTYTVTQHSVDQGTYLVLGVVQEYCGAIVRAIGGLAGGEQVEQRCIWTLLHKA